MNKPGRNFDANFLTWSSLILTALSQFLYKGEFVFKALPKSAWKEVINKLIDEKEGVCYLRKEYKEKLFKNFENFARSEWYVEKELLESFLNFIIKRFEDEFKYIALKEPPDPKYQTLILIDLKA